MKIPDIPANEVERLASLYSFAVLDTPMEEAFDDLAQIAAHIFQAPIALISLVDVDRQWFKARVGIEMSELPRSVSFCDHAMRDDQALVIPDALADSRFADDPLVIGEPGVRFYAGTPLRTPEGFSIGTLCAIDVVPRNATPGQLDALERLGKQVVYLLEKRRMRMRALADEAAARAAVAQLSVLFDAMAEGVVVQNASGHIVTNNRAASAILGLTDEHLRGRSSLAPSWRTVREDGTPFPTDEHPVMRALHTGVDQQNVLMGLYKPSGELTWLRINSIPMRTVDGGALEVVTTFRDVSEIRRAGERLAQQDRLVMTGTLVAGVGHEINNPLAFVMGNIDLALEELRTLAGPSPSARMRDLLEMLGEAKVGTERIRRIVRALRSLAREDFALHAIDLEAVADTSISMAIHELRQKATVRVDLGGLPPVLGDESRLTQVLVNLLVNAAQAFERADPDANRVTIEGRCLAGDRVQLSVVDNGPGIPADLLARIFDPFFTTKPVGEGTGLGLAVSRGIVVALGGELTVASTPGAGATFHVTLQVARDLDEQWPAVTIPVGGRRGRILIVDDDAAVRSIMRRALSREHDVTAVSDSREAERILFSDQTFDVVFSDIMMPHITGAELYQRVKERYPVLADRFVFVTAGATRDAVRDFLAGVSNEMLEKPFEIAELVATARRHVTLLNRELTDAPRLGDERR